MNLYEIHFTTILSPFSATVWAHDDKEAIDMIRRIFVDVVAINSVQYKQLGYPQIISYNKG